MDATNDIEFNPLRAWLRRKPKPMTQREFCERVGISQSFLTALLSDTPPWPSRNVMRKITEATEGAVTPDKFVVLEDPPPRLSKLSRAA
jgi:transcriptional regulator with XRE-family HTH domain